MLTMPLLDKEQLEALNRKPITTCPRCGRAVRPNYCRACDEFFDAGHIAPDCAGGTLHDAHRTY